MARLPKIKLGKGGISLGKPLRPTIAKKPKIDIDKAPQKPKPKDQEDKEKKKKKGKHADTPGIITMTRAFEVLYDWYWGEPEMDERGKPLPFTVEQAAKNVKRSILNPYTLMCGFTEEVWDDLVQRMTDARLPQGKQGRSGWFTSKGFKKRIHYRQESVVPSSVRERVRAREQRQGKYRKEELPGD